MMLDAAEKELATGATHEPAPPLRAVLYDFDGTLADTTELIMSSYRHTMGVHLGEVPPDQEWLSGFGTPLANQLARFARSGEEHAAMLDTYRSFQRLHYEQLVQPFSGAVAAVEALAARGVRLAIVTSRHRESTLRGMELCGLLDHVQTIITPEDVTHPKPHPEPVLRAVTELGIPPMGAVFVGDSPHDIAAGCAAGTRTAAALWGPFARARLEAERPDVLLHQQRDVLRLVAGVGADDAPGPT